MKAANYDRLLAQVFYRWAPASELAEVAAPRPPRARPDEPACVGSVDAVESNLRWLRFAFGVEPG